MRHLTTTAALTLCGVLALGAPAGANDFYARGMQKAAAKDWPSALDLFEQAVAAEPNNLRYGTDYRQAVIESGEYDLSLRHYRKAAEIDPKFPEAYFGIGLLFYTLGDDENAIRYYLQSLECNPRDADTRNNLGLIYYRRGELDLARDQIEEAPRLQPRFPDAQYNLGLVFYQKNDLKDAMRHFENVISQDPGYLRARFNLGVVY